MSLEKLIKSWFYITGGGGLVLPDGWFGKPYDSTHHLTKVIKSSDSLEIILSDQLNLKFEGLPIVKIVDDKLIISSFYKLVFSSRGNSSKY